MRDSLGKFNSFRAPREIRYKRRTFQRHGNDDNEGRGIYGTAIPLTRLPLQHHLPLQLPHHHHPPHLHQDADFDSPTSRQLNLILSPSALTTMLEVDDGPKASHRPYQHPLQHDLRYTMPHHAQHQHQKPKRFYLQRNASNLDEALDGLSGPIYWLDNSVASGNKSEKRHHNNDSNNNNNNNDNINNNNINNNNNNNQYQQGQGEAETERERKMGLL